MSEETIFVGLSGGVDSAVTLALTKKQLASTRAIFMRNWSKDFSARGVRIGTMLKALL